MRKSECLRRIFLRTQAIYILFILWYKTGGTKELFKWSYLLLCVELLKRMDVFRRKSESWLPEYTTSRIFYPADLLWIPCGLFTLSSRISKTDFHFNKLILLPKIYIAKNSVKFYFNLKKEHTVLLHSFFVRFDHFCMTYCMKPKRAQHSFAFF